MSALKPKNALSFLLPGTILLAIPSVLVLAAGAEEKGKAKDTPAKKGAPAARKDAAGGKGGEKAEDRDLETWGTAKEVKGSPFFTLSYTKSDGKKATKAAAFVKPAEDAAYFQDRIIPITDLKEKDEVWIFGRPVEHEVADKTGNRGVDYQLQNVTAMATGAGIRINSDYKDPRDPKAVWSKAEVARAGPSIQATIDGVEYKVSLGKQAPILLREKVEAKPIKSGATVEVSCDKSEERPDTKSAADEKKESYVAKRIVILDRRLIHTLYPMLLEQ